MWREGSDVFCYIGSLRKSLREKSFVAASLRLSQTLPYDEVEPAVEKKER